MNNAIVVHKYEVKLFQLKHLYNPDEQQAG